MNKNYFRAPCYEIQSWTIWNCTSYWNGNVKQFNTLHCNLTRLENNNIQFTTHASIYQFSCHYYFVLMLLLSDSIPFLPIPFPHLASHIFLNQLANGNCVYESTDAAHTCLLFVVICFTTAALYNNALERLWSLSFLVDNIGTKDI